jgi:VanZ family protein
MESEFTRRIALLWWATCIAWAALIFYLSTQTFGPNLSRPLLAWVLDVLQLRVSRGTFGYLHALVRGSAHLTEYAIFALLLYGLPVEKHREHWRPRWAMFCVLVAAVYALTDEFHQLFVPGRHASLLDCGLDAVGAALAMLVPFAQEQISLLKSNASHVVRGSVPHRRWNRSTNQGMNRAAMQPGGRVRRGARATELSDQ